MSAIKKYKEAIIHSIILEEQVNLFMENKHFFTVVQLELSLKNLINMNTIKGWSFDVSSDVNVDWLYYYIAILRNIINQRALCRGT